MPIQISGVKEGLIEEIRLNLLPTLPGYDNMLTVSGLSISFVEELLSELSGSDVYLEDFNGCDMDWSHQFSFNDLDYHAWGSGREGTICIMIKE